MLDLKLKGLKKDLLNDWEKIIVNFRRKWEKWLENIGKIGIRFWVIDWIDLKGGFIEKEEWNSIE